MKRNLFAIFLAVMLVAALMLVVAPSAKANESTLIVAEADKTYDIDENGKILDLNGLKNIAVNVAADVTLSVIDSANMAKDGAAAGSLAISGEGTVAPVAFYGDYRYLKIANEDGTYSFHPFNLTISGIGLNTIGQDISLRVTFFANDVAKAKITDYGIKKLTGEAASISAAAKYTFGDKNLIHAYYDLDGSLAADKLDTTHKYQAYMVIDGVEVVSNYTPEVTPRQVLKKINNDGLTPSETQKAAIEAMAVNAHLADLFTSVTGATCSHNAKVAVTCVAPEICKNCDTTFGEANRLIGHIDADDNDLCDHEGCTSIVTTPGKYTEVLLNNGAASNAWEITGTMKRPTGGADQWNFGFDIISGDKKLMFTATSGGLIFERVQGVYSRYPYHYNGLSQYNLSDATDGFHQANNQNDTLYFRAVIENDVFFAWFGYTEDNMVLTWMIPLAEELTGRWGAAQWADFNDSGYNGDDKSVPFPGFDASSDYQVAMFVNSTPAASGSINDMVIKTGADAAKVAPKFLANLNRNFASFDYLNGTLNTKAGVLNQINLVGDSKTWEMTGKIKRNGTEALNFGFMLQSGNKSLRMSAVTEGVLFESEEHSGHGRFPYHAMSGVTKYNLNPSIGQFLKAEGKDTINYRAMVAGDMFYVWFWYDGEQPTLSWVIPLTETLTGTDAHTWTVDNSGEYSGAFTGFDADSSYKMSFYVKGTSSTAAISDFTVKTGFEAPKFVFTNTPNGTVDNMAGSIIHASTQITDVDFAGSSNAIELGGTMNSVDATNPSFGFTIRSGNKTLSICAASSGIVFGEDGRISGHSRYPFHCFGATQYNKFPDINKFLSSNAKDTMHFKAVIANDMFYVWYWYDGEQMPASPSWIIPLTEELTGAPGQPAWSDYVHNNVPSNPFKGFDAGSKYTLNIFLRAGANFNATNLTFKTGANVDTSIIPAN